MQETFVEFAFDAAHKTTPDTPLHGHSFKARIFLSGSRHPVFGWSHDLLEVRTVINQMRDRLDNTCLNDIAGLEYPTLENIAAWLWHQLDPLLPGLDRVQLWRGLDGFAEGTIYSGCVILGTASDPTTPANPRPTRRGLGRRTSLMLMLSCGAVAHRSMAALPAPAQEPILTIDGQISDTNDKTVARFDRSMLEAMDQTVIETRTPWYDGVVRFEGVLMAQLVSAVGGSGTYAIATALNDYQCRIPISDFARFGVLLAMKRDGKYMSIRDKGPLFIVYPFDSNPELQNSTYTSRCAWQVRRITFV